MSVKLSMLVVFELVNQLMFFWAFGSVDELRHWLE